MTRDEKYDIGHYETDYMTDEDVLRLLKITEQADRFEVMMMEFDCAMAKVRTKLENLNKEIPLLKNHTYGVLVDNKLTDGKHRWVDINAGAAVDVARQFKEILNV